MPDVSMLNWPDSRTDFFRLSTKVAASLFSGRNTIPGLVQNWPAPRVKDLNIPAEMFSPFSRSAPGKIKTGLVLPISAKTGMGS